MDTMIIPLILSGIGVVVAALTFVNREKPDWQRHTQALLALATGQVALGALAWYVLNQ